MHVQQETWFGDASDDREDPTLIWTGSRARVELYETAPPPPSSNAPLVLWSVIPAFAALFGAAVIMRVLVVAAPVPQSNAAPALATEHAPAPPPLELATESAASAITTSATPAPASTIVDEPAREVEPTRRSIARAHPRRAHAKQATDAGAPGTLRINSLPWAEVYLDGTHVGSTPQSKLSMKPGRHRVKLVNEQMALRKTFDVYIRPGQVVTRSENLSL
jgi:serine/threonine-protein kinase